jgi:hypothetical protein
VYQKTDWEDHVTQYENRFREYANADGSITHIPDEGEIVFEGTPQNARNFNNMENGIFEAGQIGAETARISRHTQQSLAALKGESGTATLGNALAYPFNNSVATVSRSIPRDKADYGVDIDAGIDTSGIVGRVYVYDKLANGFKIAFTGSAASVAVKYVVRGGAL